MASRLSDREFYTFLALTYSFSSFPYNTPWILSNFTSLPIPKEVLFFPLEDSLVSKQEVILYLAGSVQSIFSSDGLSPIPNEQDRLLMDEECS